MKNRIGWVLLMTAPMALFGCDNDIGITGNAQCDGQKQPSEDTVDSPFDADNDGFFDGSNAGCVAAYDASALDCDDRDEDIHPGADEVACNGADDDCDAETPDDDECTESDDFSGTYIVTPAVSYACAFNSVTLSVSSFTVTDANPTILVVASGDTQPGSMSGSFDSANGFVATNAISSGGGGCDETYSVDATFTSADEMSGTLTATFFDASGIGGCFDCADQTFSFTAVR